MKEKIPHNPAQVVEAVAAHGNDTSRDRVQGMVARDHWGMEFPDVPTARTMTNQLAIRTKGGGIRFMTYSRVPY